MKLCIGVLAVLIVLASVSCSPSRSQSIEPRPINLQLSVKVPFEFVAYGDTRFTDPQNTKASNPVARQALVQAIATVHPAFITIAGDIAYHGDEVNDWRVWDSETAAWRQFDIPVFPALGNHDLHGDHELALANYFARFPRIMHSRYYAVRAANSIVLVLDSSLDELSGSQGDWLKQQLGTIPADVDFLFLVLHHPPYTSSSDRKKYGGGHSARPQEQVLAQMLEQRQRDMHARIVVFAGHVHNYERHEHGGVLYFVSGGGGAHAYPIERGANDPFRDNNINYHYLLVKVDREKLNITMDRLDLSRDKPVYSVKDTVTTAVRTAVPAEAAR